MDESIFFIEMDNRQGMRRPMSYSDSFVANMEPSDVVFLRTPVSENIVVVKKPSYYVEFLLRVLFHVSLISIFETLFFFVYVSALEDKGILTIVNAYIGNVANTCQNMTLIQKQLVQDVLTYVNASEIIRQGDSFQVSRTQYNKQLFNQAWYYMTIFVSMFGALSAALYYKQYTVNYKIVFAENCIMILFLALYELMFFQTIIFPYKAIGAPEIDRNFMQQIEWSCS